MGYIKSKDSKESTLITLTPTSARQTFLIIGTLNGDSNHIAMVVTTAYNTIAYNNLGIDRYIPILTDGRIEIKCTTWTKFLILSHDDFI